MEVKIKSIERVFDHVFKIDEITAAHELPDGQFSPFFPWLVFERGDAAAIILYKSDSKEVVLVRQFRAPTLRCAQSETGYVALNDGQLDETVAGMPMPGETMEDCAIREVREEAGYIIKRPELIAQFYASPGGTSERIFLYYAVVTDANKAPESDQIKGGVKGDNEHTIVRHVPVSKFFAQMVEPDKLVDSKVLIASLILRQRLSDIPEQDMLPAQPATICYRLKSDPKKVIGLKTGDMLHVHDVDAWVNSENTDMEMDRFIGRSISALIRYAGAAKDDQERVIEDTIAMSLKKAMRGRQYSRIGTVHDTTSGSLKATNNVLRIFHVAAVEGAFRSGARANAEYVETVTLRTLRAVERRSGRLLGTKYKSAMLPMIGTGDGGLPAEVSFPEMLKGVLKFYGQNKRTRLQSVFISAYTVHGVAMATHYLDLEPGLERI